MEHLVSGPWSLNHFNRTHSRHFLGSISHICSGTTIKTIATAGFRKSAQSPTPLGMPGSLRIRGAGSKRVVKCEDPKLMIFDQPIFQLLNLSKFTQQQIDHWSKSCLPWTISRNARDDHPPTTTQSSATPGSCRGRTQIPIESRLRHWVNCQGCHANQLLGFCRCKKHGSQCLTRCWHYP